MNKFTKALILGTAAIATLAATMEIAPAADWQNRGFRGHPWRYHHGRYIHGGVAAGIIGGLAAGVIVGEALSEPRVVYRERPDVVDEPVYVDRDAPEYVGPVDEAQPEDDTYVEERTTQRRVYQTQRDVYTQRNVYQDDQGQMDDQDQMGEQAQDENYFPDRPQKQHTRRNTDVAEQGTLQPWTAKWRTYCKQRFTSFNATTGTYTGYDGKSHFCTAG